MIHHIGIVKDLTPFKNMRKNLAGKGMLVSNLLLLPGSDIRTQKDGVNASVIVTIEESLTNTLIGKTFSNTNGEWAFSDLSDDYVYVITAIDQISLKGSRCVDVKL